MRIGALVLLMLSAAVARAGTDVGTGKVYAGPEGMTVTVVPTGTPGDHKVLVAVAGSGSPFDGKVIPHDEIGYGDGLRYETTYHGRRWVTAAVRNGVPSLNVPGHRDGIKIWFDEKKTAALKLDPLYAGYAQQQADGSLRALMAFDRKGEIAQHDKEMQADADAVAKICGAKPAVKIDWASFSDDDLKDSVDRQLLRRAARDDAADVRRFDRGEEDLRRAREDFHLHDGEKHAARSGGHGADLDHRARRDQHGRLRARLLRDEVMKTTLLLVLLVLWAGRLAVGGETPPWGKGETLGERMTLEKTAVCTDGKSHYVVVAPSEKQSVQLYYGDGKTFHRVPLPPWVLTGQDFFEPRFFAPTKNSNFRGLDMRLFASADYDAGKKSCSVSCGPRTTPLTLMDEEAKRALLGKASYEPPLAKRAPHRLARDENGRYFYVDKGNTPETEKSFRLYVGPKGAMKLQKMTNAVADTEGEIFTTKSGSLRYVTDRQKPPILDPGQEAAQLDRGPDRIGRRQDRRADQQLPAHLQRARGLSGREAGKPLRRFCKLALNLGLRP